MTSEKKIAREKKRGEAMDWDCGFSASSYQQFMLDEGEMEEFRSEKSVKTGKVRKYARIISFVSGVCLKMKCKSTKCSTNRTFD